MKKTTNTDLRRELASARRSVLSSWRGVDLAPLEVAWTNSANGMEQLMPNVLHKLGLDERRAEAEIVKVWKDLIDPTVVAHAQPTGIHNGTLFVSVDSNVWLDEIVRYHRREILTRLQHSFGRGKIKKISFRVG